MKAVHGLEVGALSTVLQYDGRITLTLLLLGHSIPIGLRGLGDNHNKQACCS